MSAYDGVALVFLLIGVLMALSYITFKGDIAILNIKLETTDKKLEILTQFVEKEIKRLQDRVG